MRWIREEGRPRREELVDRGLRPRLPLPIRSRSSSSNRRRRRLPRQAPSSTKVNRPWALTLVLSDRPHRRLTPLCPSRRPTLPTLAGRPTRRTSTPRSVSRPFRLQPRRQVRAQEEAIDPGTVVSLLRVRHSRPATRRRLTLRARTARAREGRSTKDTPTNLASMNRSNNNSSNID